MKHYAKLFVAILTTMLWLATTALAGEWTVSRVTGPAVYTLDGKTWGKVTLGLNLPNAAWVNTGPQGKVQLTRGMDTIFIGSYSLVAAYKKSAQRTQIRQDFGTVTIDVQKRNYDHMGVETPYMAAVVKGTKFTVSANKSRTTISVSRGRVDVEDRRTGAKASIGSGQQVKIKPEPETALAVVSKFGRITPKGSSSKNASGDSNGTLSGGSGSSSATSKNVSGSSGNVSGGGGSGSGTATSGIESGSSGSASGGGGNGNGNDDDDDDDDDD